MTNAHHKVLDAKVASVQTNYTKLDYLINSFFSLYFFFFLSDLSLAVLKEWVTVLYQLIRAAEQALGQG